VNFKTLGNEAFRRKEFDVALDYYKSALEVSPENPIIMGNIGAVQIEQQRYEDAIESCDKAIAYAFNIMVDFKTRAKFWARKANALVKLERFGEAIECFEKSLIEHEDRLIDKKRKQIILLKKKLDDENYVDEEKANAHKELGAKHFQNAHWPEAVREFTESIRRSPKDPKLYTNRSLCYVKLMEWGRALEDADKAIELDPTFVKAYLRKGKVQHFLKQYHKALQTYKQALVVAPDDRAILDAMQETRIAVQMANMSGEADPERQKRAMEDPEVQRIMKDPQIAQVLQDLQSNPQAAQKLLADPHVRENIEMLVAAGVLQMR